MSALSQCQWGDPQVATLSWQSPSAAEPEREYVALLSYLPLKRVWRLPWFMLQSVRIQRQLRACPRGLIGYSLEAQVAARRFWTLSAWEDEGTLQQFVHASPHAEIMTAIVPHMDTTRFIRWKVKGSELPLGWDDAMKRFHLGH
jgi:hypothetical protein